MILFGLLAVASVQASRPPQTPAVAAFASICAGTTTVDEAVERALRSGWTEQAPDTGSEFALLVNTVAQPGAPNRGRTFAHEVQGRRLNLWVRVAHPARFTECRVYDFDVERPDALIADTIAWRGTPEVDSGVLPGGARAVAWSAPNQTIITASHESMPCPTSRGCRGPRFVLDHSVERKD